MPFQINAPYSPGGDQPEAIKQLVNGLRAGEQFQTL
jgi:excinuclease ABC subunit B